MTRDAVRGVDVGPHTRCAHYHTSHDVVAFKFACCERYYSCFRCHEEVTDHESEPWHRNRFDEPSVLCGVCDTTLTVPDYLEADYRCPACGAAFNPGCASHAEVYFETERSDS
ncbi:CHY zinc finger protein [Natrinema caseinilyticum]|uniref:CHY zinc finger protein n=1 Tax=Natrinema caseinilyticum TaxID=2961570 RepID=UPI0020C339E2|nr:CHY zinc finger protein [Natrinema caseinilyticum]